MADGSCQDAFLASPADIFGGPAPVQAQARKAMAVIRWWQLELRSPDEFAIEAFSDFQSLSTIAAAGLTGEDCSNDRTVKHILLPILRITAKKPRQGVYSSVATLRLRRLQLCRSVPKGRAGRSRQSRMRL